MALSDDQLLPCWQQYKTIRAMILDACEQEMGGSPRWQYLRSRLLKYLGQNGMERIIVQFLEASRLNEQDIYSSRQPNE